MDQLSLFPQTTTESSAVLSACRQYRYRLDRRWAGGQAAVFIGLNPSTADERQDDHTVRKLMGFAKRWNCGAITMLNLFAFRATKPAEMKRAADPIGPENDRWLLETCKPVGIAEVVCCWGVDGEWRGRGAEVRRLLCADWLRLRCFGLAANGEPLHPLYLPYTTELQDF